MLKAVWEAAQYPWSVRLEALLPLWLVWIRKRWNLTVEEERQLLSMSSAVEWTARFGAAHPSA